ncbi:MFS transporter [Acidiphilium sp.]|uniref:MFS transporter n=1 Tax=Acidiphilium sp. TaxID=527 RepID=UPI003D0722E1
MSPTTSKTRTKRRSNPMTKLEQRASYSLASIYGLRMLGLFLILPVFSIYAKTLPDGHDRFLVGLALGIYGFTQACLQIPLGIASDRYGRKPVMIAGLAVFALGSFIAGFSHTLPMIIVGRAIQGAGAISAAISAMIADSTRPENRTRAMAFVGMMIGLSFIIALVAGPLLYRSISVPGMFLLTGVLAIGAVFVVKFVVPDVKMGASEPAHPDAAMTSAVPHTSLFTPALLRLDFSIFALNFMQVALFLALPLALVNDAGIPIENNWIVYLPVAILSFIVAIPGIIWAETRGYLRHGFIGAVALMGLAMIGFAAGYHDIVALVCALFVFFVGFNLLEALLPSLVSRTAPPSRKGRALGVYNTAQSIGLFAGGAVGGIAADLGGSVAVFLTCAVLGLVWLIIAAFVQAPAKHSI